ncbi:MAG: hypothetical protein ACYC6Y_20715 [Thermoguttaceae bacterium]
MCVWVLAVSVGVAADGASIVEELADDVRVSAYFVEDPVTGKTMWNNQPGDYDGYNERFGGLPAFRAAIERYTQQGALVTLYTDPIRCDDASKLGRAHGKDWSVIQADGKPVTSYEVWNM